MRNTPFLSTLGLALAALVPAAPAAGQTLCALDQVCASEVTALLPEVAQLELGPVTHFDPITAQDLTDGFKDAALPLNYSVSSNVRWELTIAAAAAEWTGGGDLKPSTDLLWSDGSGPGATPLHVSGGLVTSGSPTQSVGGQIFYRSLWYWNDTPDNYSLTVNFTLSAP